MSHGTSCSAAISMHPYLTSAADCCCFCGSFLKTLRYLFAQRDKVIVIMPGRKQYLPRLAVIASDQLRP